MNRHTILSICGIGLTLALAGCQSNGGGAAFTEQDLVPPVVSGFTITAPAGGWRAGACRVSLHATDNQQVTSVVARLSGPNAPTDPTALALVSGTADQYQGDVPVPANINSDGSPVTYYVTAWAIDNAGNSTSVENSLSFTVPAPEAPQPPPTF